MIVVVDGLWEGSKFGEGTFSSSMSALEGRAENSDEGVKGDGSLEGGHDTCALMHAPNDNCVHASSCLGTRANALPARVSVSFDNLLRFEKGNILYSQLVEYPV